MSDAHNEAVKVVAVSPSPDYRFDFWYVEAKDNWESTMEAVEQSLDAQFNNGEWDDIKCTITCKTITRKELEDICNNE